MQPFNVLLHTTMNVAIINSDSDFFILLLQKVQTVMYIQTAEFLLSTNVVEPTNHQFVG